MTTSNKELFNWIQQADMSAPLDRERNKKILLALYPGDYRIAPKDKEIDSFIERANDTEGIYRKSSVVSANELVKEDPDYSAERLIKHARHKLLMIDVLERIEKINDDSATVDEKNYLGKIASIATSSESENTKRFRYYHDFNDFNDFSVDPVFATNIKNLATKATEKLAAIEAVRKKDVAEKTAKWTDLTTSKSELLETTFSEMQALIVDIDKLNSTASLKDALDRIDGEIEANEISLKDKKNRNNKAFLEEKGRKLSESKAALQAAEKRIQQARDHLGRRLKSVESLRDQLNLYSIELNGLNGYKVVYENTHPTPNNKMEKNKVYCRKNKGKKELSYFVRDRNGDVKEGTLQFKLINGFNGHFSAIENNMILSEIAKNNHTFGVYDDSKINSGLALVENAGLRADELNEYVKRNRELLELCKTLAADPEANRTKIEKRSNFLIRIMALSDIHSSPNGKPYFIEEIIRKGSQDNKPDGAFQHGLEGHIISRSVYLNEGDIKRSTCNIGNSKICIETKIRTTATGKEIGVVTDRTAFSTLDDNAKRLAAVKFASELLYKYKPGSGDPIILNGRGEHAEQAAMVHAALLMLTAPNPDDKDEDYIQLDPGCIKVNVPGADKPSLLGKSRKSFREQYIKSAEFAATKIEVTAAYKGLYKTTTQNAREIEDVAPEVEIDRTSLHRP
ncbi:MAG: hypothetical protein Q8R83_05430 [Legionellaceae bacterium]|nr:hypothetical protein [Legionellaceae bacterium]